ncbi:coiled-coil domain-containing protein CG32809 isoform X2 [Glossina fuscipes]|uniref:Coiled-coil domain-containing protein CG32809 isoform X2 n=1 Tax=Glossina fuscipes TaxID=7396 RepID=A0A8U0W4M9_9MUSC|nr:coiled-coil domain-containing protein CG32809 isoform X2 [Glossina fuscipes]
MLIRWKSKDKGSTNQTNASGGGGGSNVSNSSTGAGGGSSGSSSSSKKKRKGREGGDERRRGMRREDPRRHTLGGDMLAYANQPNQQQPKSMDLEMSTRNQKTKKMQATRGYQSINQGPLFDDDPGIMSEVETSSTGFRRGGKQRSSLPVVRTPSKTLERPLGLVFLQYRSETKRALLPNEITSIDTVRALFVRSFPRQLTMSYLEGPNVKIYIHDASKDMFYELEDVRSHLREIRDRSVLRLFESTEVAAPPQILPGGPGIPQPLPQPTPTHWDQDQSYFSEPEFDSDYKTQHIHKSKIGKQQQQAPYYVGASQTLPRGMYATERQKVPMGTPLKPLRTPNSRGSMEPLFPYPPDQLYSIPDGYTSSPERSTRGNYEEPYYSQYGTRGPVIAPIIDEEQADVSLNEDQYALYGMKIGPGRLARPNQLYEPTRPEDLHRIRVEHMERQLANLTGLVQKALVNQNPQIAPMAVPTLDANYLVVPTQCHVNGAGEDLYVREKAPKLGKNACQKSVSFEKSVSFSDDIQGIPKAHSPQHAADTKPTKPAIKSSTLPRTSSQERDRLKPPPPPKPIVLTQTAHSNYRADIALAPEVYNHLRGLQKKAKDLRMEVRTLRRLSQAQAVAVREDIKGTFMRIRATLLASSGSVWGGHQGDQDATRISREEELYKQEVIRLEKDLSDLEASVESLRGEVINRRTRVNMTAVEDMALVLSRASKTVAELKMKFPALANGLRCILSNEMEKVVREEKFLKDEPDRLESALRRCKKLTGTLVTLKRLASVQEQRLPPSEPQINEDPPRSADVSTADKPIPTPRMGTFAISGGPPPENALDALLDELQTFSKPLIQNNEIRPDDSVTSDNNTFIQSTVTTQISQARLYKQTDANMTQQQQQQQHQQQAHLLANDLAANNLNILNQNNTGGILTSSIIGTGPMSSLRRLHSMPTQCESDIAPTPVTRNTIKPPVPERNADLIMKVGCKRIPPPPPPRTSSRSPLTSPTSPNMPQTLVTVNETDPVNNNADACTILDSITAVATNCSNNDSTGNDHIQRQVALEIRHQELLKKQKLLQEQYQRLQQMSKLPSVDMTTTSSSTTIGTASLAVGIGNAVGFENIIPLKKMGSESNIQQKMGLSLASNSNSNTNSNNISTSNTLTEATQNSIIKPIKNDITADITQQQNVNNKFILNNLKANNITTGNSAGINNSINTTTSGVTTTTTTTTKQVYETEIL